MTDSPQIPAAVFETLAERLAARDWEGAAQLYSPDVVVTNRFRPEGPEVNKGRDAVRAFFNGLGGRLDRLTVEDRILTPGHDPERLTAEFTFAATAGGGAVQFTLPAIFVMHVRDGLIVSSNDYIGPQQTA